MKLKAEDILSMSIASLAAWRFPPAVYATCIGHGSRNAWMADKLLKMGVRAGFPDWLIAYDGRLFVIELKVDGYPSAPQRECHEALRVAGACVAVCRSAENFFDQCATWGIPLRDERPIDEWNDEVGF